MAYNLLNHFQCHKLSYDGNKIFLFLSPLMT
ncbi:hypothetical protein COLO4_03018 [Corchorus olitorius]|uniref:Uncharacterized protein n=1 Tax=Corchorus olitorius TaxID=93759 RepID=A0A1R3KZP1_9ROSI|nr:hypothetical protein COLO4_03018 [Corchorus olitorius]